MTSFRKVYVFSLTYADKNSKLWKTDFSLQLLQPLQEDLGSFWEDLGRALNLREAKLYNIGEEKNSNKQKAFAVLLEWKQREGNAATIGHLAVVLQKIGKNNIVGRLIGMLFFVCFCFVF